MLRQRHLSANIQYMVILSERLWASLLSYNIVDIQSCYLFHCIFRTLFKASIIYTSKFNIFKLLNMGLIWKYYVNLKLMVLPITHCPLCLFFMGQWVNISERRYLVKHISPEQSLKHFSMNILSRRNIHAKLTKFPVTLFSSLCFLVY